MIYKIWSHTCRLLANRNIIVFTSRSNISQKMQQTPKKSKVSILWFRNDLRLNDNLALNQCIDNVNKCKVDYILPFYCFDNSVVNGQSRLAKLPRCGVYRRNFLIESIENLKENLIQKLKSNLCIGYGQPEQEIHNLVNEISKTWVVDSVITSKEIPSEEVELEQKINQMLKTKNIKLTLVWDSTMIHIDDLPYGNPSRTPDIFTGFRKTVEINGESNYNVRKPFGPQLNALPTVQLSNWGHEKIPKKAETENKAIIQSAINDLFGGEDAALARTDYYFNKTKGLSIYKTTRNGLIGREYSSKLSMWLSLGCVSSRYLYWMVKDFEKVQKANESTRAFVFELLWRDFFKFHSIKHGKYLFYPYGSHPVKPVKWSNDMGLFEQWCKGETGYPFVDANMKELNETGWMSNRGRQNVASFLSKDLDIDWRYGAEYFETMLIDYDCTSNWGNWQYVAGVGSDPRSDRHFNVIKQGFDYDENGDYVRSWLPQLKHVPNDCVHCPYLMSTVQQRMSKCEIGVNYPAPIVRMKFEWKLNNGPKKVNKFVAKSKRNYDF